MMRFGSTAVVLASVVSWLAVLFAVDPFEQANAAMDRAFGALPAWTQVENMYSDAATQEITRGEDPRKSFDVLEKAWASHPAATRVVLMGNSQTQMTSLAPGEAPPQGPEKTYTDLLADAWRHTDSTVFYRLSAGALSYEEMLWYTAYLVTQPAIKPNVLLVQLNYQNFVNSGIRGGMTSLLADPAFRRNLDAIIAGKRADAGNLEEAVRRYEQGRAAQDTTAASNAQAPPGAAIENAFRERLDPLPGMRSRSAVKQSFAMMLVRGRTYFLRAGTNNRRSLAGAHVDAARAALEDLAALSARHGIRMILFQAPTNPAVPLYKTSEDDRSYHDFAATVASRYGLTLLDFEHCVPAERWGMALNVPDPLHLGREGHRLLAGRILGALRENGL